MCAIGRRGQFLKRYSAREREKPQECGDRMLWKGWEVEMQEKRLVRSSLTRRKNPRHLRPSPLRRSKIDRIGHSLLWDVIGWKWANWMGGRHGE